MEILEVISLLPVIYDLKKLNKGDKLGQLSYNQRLSGKKPKYTADFI